MIPESSNQKARSSAGGPTRQTYSASDSPTGRGSRSSGQWSMRVRGLVRDSLGLVLIAVVAMSILAMTRVTQGSILSPLANILSTWLGWGSYLILLGAAAGGVLILRRGVMRIRPGQLVALELAALLTLALLAAINRNDLGRADAGQDGGRVGWGLSTLISMLLGST